MRKQPLYLALGSNLGDREGNIRTAMDMLEDCFGPCEKMSPVIETESIGFKGGAFLNCIAVYRSARHPETILGTVKRIEREMGRTDAPEYDSYGRRIYHDRVIDIDILTYGNLKISTEKLTIPHPQVESRPFIKELLLFLSNG